MLVVGPCYINEHTLPFCSDIIYHRKILYFLPTGFHPIELESVSNFPKYCYENSIALHPIVWEMCSQYFDNDVAAMECNALLSPLRKQYIHFVQPVYARDKPAILRAKREIDGRSELIGLFRDTGADSRFISRELLSHVLYEIVIKDGIEGAIGYLGEETSSFEKLEKLAAAVVFNRLRSLEPAIENLGIYEHAWYPLIRSYFGLCENDTDEGRVEHFRYKVFEALLLPLYGKCDSREKAVMIHRLLQEREEQIDALKDECQKIATEVVLLPTSSQDLRQKTLTGLLTDRIVVPLSNAVEKPRDVVVRLLKEFLFDSTVIGGLLAATIGGTGEVMGTAAAAGALSTGFRQLLKKPTSEALIPPRFLVDAVKRSGSRAEEYYKHLAQISLTDVEIPDEWKTKENGQIY